MRPLAHVARIPRPTRSGSRRKASATAKVASDEHAWELYVNEQKLEVGAYPSEERVVEFAVWMSMRRERACLTQRPGEGARLTGDTRASAARSL